MWEEQLVQGAGRTVATAGEGGGRGRGVWVPLWVMKFGESGVGGYRGEQAGGQGMAKARGKGLRVRGLGFRVLVGLCPLT